MYNASPPEKFVRTNNANDERDIARSAKQVTREFELTEVVSTRSQVSKKFQYESEQARNFDQTNINKAREGAKEILRDTINKAKVKAIQIREEARILGYDEGYTDGFAKGEKGAREEFAPFLQTTQQLIRDIARFRKMMYTKAEREMIEIVISLAKKVIHYELTVREDSIQEMIRLAVQSVLDKESMIIKINPMDKGYAESFRPELHQLFDEIKNITFEAVPAIQRGGCVIETNFGSVDARIENLNEQIDKILSLAPETMVEEDEPEPQPE